MDPKADNNLEVNQFNFIKSNNLNLKSVTVQDIIALNKKIDPRV